MQGKTFLLKSKLVNIETYCQKAIDFIEISSFNYTFIIKTKNLDIKLINNKNTFVTQRWIKAYV